MDRECLSTVKSFCFHDTMPTTYKQNYNLSFLQKQKKIRKKFLLSDTKIRIQIPSVLQSPIVISKTELRRKADIFQNVQDRSMKKQNMY